MDKVGLFIKKLRTDKGMSQNDLAELIPIDRSVISKWERGEAFPPIDKMKILCDIFNVSIDELISGELKTSENEKEQAKNVLDFLLKQDSKYKRLKLFSIIIFIVALIISFLFLIYYFLETHNTEKIYRISGESENYTLREGILVITREKSYLKLGSINDEIYDIELYYKKDDKNILIYSGRSDMILSDRYGYHASLNNMNLYDIRNDLYVKVDGEEIKLNLSDEYFNDNLKLDNWIDYNDDEVAVVDGVENVNEIIKREFKCDKTVCRKTVVDIEITYSIDSSKFYVKDGDINMDYEMDNGVFTYISKYEVFTFYDSNLICSIGPCDNYKEIYDKYYTNLIKKYIEQ